MTYWLIYLTTLMPIKYLDIFSGLVNWWQQTTHTGDYSNKQIDVVTKALQNAAPYLHYDDFLGRLVNEFKWAIVKFFYGLANWASELATDSLNFSKILGSTGLNKNLINGVMGIAAGLMILTLTWVGIKIGTSSRPPQFKNIIWQLFIAAFLIGNVQSISNWVVDQSTGVYKGFVESKGAKSTSSLPYQIVQSNSNDLLAIIAHNFSDFKIKNENTNTSWGGVSKDKNGQIKDQRTNTVHWGSFMMDKTDFETVSAGDLSTTISSDLAAKLSNKANKSTEKPAWDPDYLRYKLTPSGVGTNSTNGKKDSYSGYSAGKVDESNLAFFKIFQGGYERYSVNFLPTVIALISMTVAFLLVSFVSVRAFLDLAIMQVLSVIVFATDLESGQRTKAAIQDIFNSALLIAFQGFELAFYRIIATWMSSAQAKGISNNAYLYAVGMIALTWALFEGSSKVSKFFGLDTGLKDGWSKSIGATAGAAYLGSRVGRGAKAMTTNLATGTKKTVQNVTDHNQAYKAGRLVETEALGRGASKEAAASAGANASKAYLEKKQEWRSNGNTNADWKRAEDTGLVSDYISEETERMKDTGGLTSRQVRIINPSNQPQKTAKTSENNSGNNTSFHNDKKTVRKEEVPNLKTKDEFASSNENTMPEKQASEVNSNVTKVQKAPNTTKTTPPVPTDKGGRHLENISNIKEKDQKIGVTRHLGNTEVDITDKEGTTAIKTNGNVSNTKTIGEVIDNNSGSKNEYITEQGSSKNVDVTIKHDKNITATNINNSGKKNKY
ncbi:hypothetical protein SAMN04487792_1625 [Lactobacillus bombicola]|uniref:DUF8208 domain-containing protein n=1 Tax=Lactobacillus bombicola TaxID=1505723 RepID=A0A1I1TV10_9LACO|nr:pilin [Lactobacillus bombicola]SFD62215.1 hypothetical protein SAMN04487792_1625 [Lactobacillus bombicola]